MNKYDDFINKLHEEANNQEIVDLKEQIKSTYQNKPEKVSSKKVNLKSWILKPALSLAFLFLLTFVVIVVRSKRPVDIPVIPSLTSSINETYAFEIMSAANIIYSQSNQTLSNMSFRRTNNEDLIDVAKRIHENYLTLQQLLYEDEIDYKIIPSTIEGYEEQMTISLKFNSEVNLEYVIYYNKVIKEIDDDEETYDLNGIMVINDEVYEISGETEIEEDETSTSIKVIISDTSYFIIEQEIEEDEQEFVYSEYQNNSKVKEYSLSYEIEDNEIELVIEYREGKNKGKLTAKPNKDKIYFEVDFDDYHGKVVASYQQEGISYYFEEEKKDIFINFSNKNNISFVY